MTESMPTPRTADPSRDLAVIDSRAPRLNQLLTGLLALAAVSSGAWPLLAVAAVQISLGLFLGRRWCLACRIYFGLVQPLLGEGPIEDSRPVKFANQIGAAFLWSATLAHVLGQHVAGDVLAAIVAALALLAASTGFCAGCSLYRGWALLRGIRGRTPGHIDLAEVGGSPGRAAVVQFTHPLCGDCRALASRLTASGETPLLVDVSRRPELARKYGVSVVPLAVAVRADGSVARQLR
jgi:thiol-disulfide isomerase/thioredoxin